MNFANSTKNYSINGNGSIGGSGALVKAGTGVVTLATTNTYTGTTTVSGGTLVVSGTLPVGTVTVASNAWLGGTGIIYGPTAVQPGGIIAPGAGGTNVATLTVSNSLNLAGNVLFTLSRTNTQTASKLAGLGSVTLGGTLTVTNIGATNFVIGDSFTLIQATNYSGSFTDVILPALPLGLSWSTNQLAVNGTLIVSNTIYTLAYTRRNERSHQRGTSPQTVIYGAAGSAVTAMGGKHRLSLRQLERRQHGQSARGHRRDEQHHGDCEFSQ